MFLLKVMVGDVVVANRVLLCNTPNSRRRGLLDTPVLGVDDGALLDMPVFRQFLPAFFSSIHMYGMPYAIAAVFLDRKSRVINTALASPGRMYFPARPARYVLEVHPDHLARFQPGDKVRWEIVDRLAGSG